MTRVRTHRLAIGLVILLTAGVWFGWLLTNALGSAARSVAPTTGPLPTLAPTTAPAPSSTTPDCTATTTGGPSGFRPVCHGPIQLTVTKVVCKRFVGDGYQLAFTVANRGPTVDGYVTAQVDDRPAIVAIPTVHLEPGAITGGADYPEVSGDAIVVTLQTATGDTVSSFPVETPACPQDPADVAGATTSTTRP